jgi:hypothetical protein
MRSTYPEEEKIMAGQVPTYEGEGVARRKRAKPVKLKASNHETSPSAGMGDWTEIPDVANQIQEPSAYKLGTQEAMVLDLSDPKDLKKYNDILSLSVSPKANLVITEKDIKFVEKTGNWKVLMTVQHVLFKKIFKKGLKPDTLEAQEQLQQSI